LHSKKHQLEQLGQKMSQPGFWGNQEAAQVVVGQLSALKAMVEPVEELEHEVMDLAELYELAPTERCGGTGPGRRRRPGAGAALRASRAAGPVGGAG
jgi:hypothetical protein